MISIAACSALHFFLSMPFNPAGKASLRNYRNVATPVIFQLLVIGFYIMYPQVSQLPQVALQSPSTKYVQVLVDEDEPFTETIITENMSLMQEDVAVDTRTRERIPYFKCNRKQCERKN